MLVHNHHSWEQGRLQAGHGAQKSKDAPCSTPAASLVAPAQPAFPLTQFTPTLCNGATAVLWSSDSTKPGQPHPTLA